MSPHHDPRRFAVMLGGFALGPTIVPPCRCAGQCRCGGLVPALLQQRLERECEFYRSEW